MRNSNYTMRSMLSLNNTGSGYDEINVKQLHHEKRLSLPPVLIEESFIPHRDRVKATHNTYIRKRIKFKRI